MTRLALAVALVAGCGSSALVGLGPVRVESRHTLNTIATCTRAAEMQPRVDLGLVLVVQELDRAGLIPDRQALARGFASHLVMACALEQPEPCVWTPRRCDGVHTDQCARRRGCASDAHLWVARLWPPICRTDWPDEPTCGPGPQTDAGVDADMVHELAEMVCRRTGTCDPHREPAASAVQRAWAAYQAARGQ